MSPCIAGSGEGATWPLRLFRPINWKLPIGATVRTAPRPVRLVGAAPTVQHWESNVHGHPGRPPGLAKKFHRLERGHLERDHYDILWAAYHGKDRATLIEAAMHFTTPEIVQVIAMEAQQDPEKLFKEPKKRVLNPKAKDWKKVLGEVWQAVDKFTSDPKARNMRLPALKGAPRRKAPWGNW